MQGLDLFNSICKFQVAKFYEVKSKIEYRYFETYEEARENVEKDKYPMTQFISRKNDKGKFEDFKIKKHGEPIQDLDPDPPPLPFHVALERSINEKLAKARRLLALGVKNLPESARVPNLSWWYARGR